MINNRKLIVDTFCEVYELVKDWADGEFWDFEHHELVPGAIYMIGREQFRRNVDRIKDIINNEQAHIILSNPAEGSDTIAGQCRMLGVQQLAFDKKLLILGGGDMDARYSYLRYDSFMVKILDYITNRESAKRMPEIYSKTDKPYKFLFLNGRTRPHRKYLLETFKRSGLLEKSLWTNLDTQHGTARWLYLEDPDTKEDLLLRPFPIHYLPKEYEIQEFQRNLDIVPNGESKFIKDHLFSNTWGEIYLRPEPYIDTYFSLVTETVFDYPHSFRTEKIWKPICMGHPWIAVSNTGYYRDIQNLGFKTFGHLIDESFDQIENSQDRIARISQVVEDLCKQDLAKFLEECYTICSYNQQHLIELSQKTKLDFPVKFEKFILTHYGR